MPLLVAIGSFFAACFLAAGINWIGLRWYPNESLHWTESARKLYPIRRAAVFNLLLIPAVFTTGFIWIQPEDSGFWIYFSVAISTFVGAIIGTYPFDKKMIPQYAFPAWLRFVCGSWLLRFGALGALVVGGVLMPDDFGWETILIGSCVAGFFLALNFGLWLQLARLAGLLARAKENDLITAIVRRMGERMKIPHRAVWILRSPVGYAAAMTTTNDLIFSEGLLNSHPEEEIAAICAHELAHLNESRSVKMTRLLGSLSMVPLIFILPMFHAGNPAVGILWLPLVLNRFFLRKLSRNMEVRADNMADLNEEESGVYAKALERLYRNNQMPAVMPGKRRVHPHLYDRMLAAGMTPDYPRPEAPGIFSWSSALLFAVLLILIAAIVS